jgi:hypothetical protein
VGQKRKSATDVVGKVVHVPTGGRLPEKTTVEGPQTRVNRSKKTLGQVRVHISSITVYRMGLYPCKIVHEFLVWNLQYREVVRGSCRIGIIG